MIYIKHGESLTSSADQGQPGLLDMASRGMEDVAPLINHTLSVFKRGSELCGNATCGNTIPCEPRVSLETVNGGLASLKPFLTALIPSCHGFSPGPSLNKFVGPFNFLQFPLNVPREMFRELNNSFPSEFAQL